jgi:putative Holliday junction resolvase
MRTLGLDIGDARIGVALSDPDGVLASPFSVVDRKEDSLAVKAIIDIVNQKKVGQIVVGLPLSMDSYTRVPVEYRDERLTTVMAQRLRRLAGGKKGKGKASDDAQAAALILQSYLDEGR